MQETALEPGAAGPAVGTMGAKNLNLRRRMPLSPLNRNTADGRSRAGDIQPKALQQRSDIALGGKAGLLTKGGDGGWSKSFSPAVSTLELEVPAQPAGLQARPGHLAANRTRVKSEVRAQPYPRCIQRA